MQLSGTYLFNSLCQSIGLATLLYHPFPGRYRRVKAVLFSLSSFTLQIMMIEVQYFILLATFALAVSIYSKPERLAKSVVKVMECHFFVVLYIVLVSSVLQLLFPSFSDGKGYDVAVGVGLVLYALLINRLLEPRKATLGKSIVEGAVFIFFSLVMPLLQADFNPDLLYTAAIFFILLISGILALLVRSDLARERKNDQLQRINRDLQAMQQQYKSAIQIRHYTINLIKSLGPTIQEGNLNAIQAYFSRYLDEIPQTITAPSILDKIRNDSIRNLLHLFQGRAEMEETKLTIHTEGEICFEKELEADLFKLLSIYLDNALEAAPGGVIQLNISTNPTVITLANTIESQKMPSQKLRGFGLVLARKIIRENPCLESVAQQTDLWYIQTIYVKEEI